MGLVGVLVIPLVIACASAARPITETLDGWVPATAVAGGCAAACSSNAALSFRAFQGSTSVDTMLCAAQTADAQWTLGYESSAGCVTSAGASATTSGAYQCRCKAQDQLQGLALPVQGSCVAGCQQGFEGSSGSAVAFGSTQACISQSQVGNDNHFGGLASDGTCHTTEGGAPVTSSSFSCVCLFNSQGSVAAQSVGG